MKTFLTVFGIIALIAVVGALIGYNFCPKILDNPLGSGEAVGVYATSTATIGYSNITDLTVLKTGSGVLNNYVVVKAGTAGGIVTLLNATTTNKNLRTDSTSGTSTLILASFPSDLAAGTYNIDAMFNNGLLYDYVGGGAVGTSTITWN